MLLTFPSLCFTFCAAFFFFQSYYTYYISNSIYIYMVSVDLHVTLLSLERKAHRGSPQASLAHLCNTHG